MKKIGRNMPCPCGSGKKYKHCCESKDITNNLDEQINIELYNAHQNLISFVKDKYSHKIEEQYARLGQSYPMDDETRQIHVTGLTPWIATTVPCLDKGQTILNRFVQGNLKKLRPHARHIVEQWQNFKPNVYEVISMDSSADQYLIIKELDGEETYYIPRLESDDVSVGTLLVGLLVPFAGHHEFMLTMVKLTDVDRNVYQELVQKHTDDNSAFPSLLASILTYDPNEESVESAEPIDDNSVEGLLSKGLAEAKVEEQVIADSLSKWKSFCTKENPTIIKMEPYAAAMEYYTRKDVLADEGATQSAIAKKYGTSPSSLSKNYRRIVEAL